MLSVGFLFLMKSISQIKQSGFRRHFLRISLYYELTKSFLFEFENDGMEPSKRNSLISLFFILKCLSKTLVIKRLFTIFWENTPFLGVKLAFLQHTLKIQLSNAVSC